MTIPPRAGSAGLRSPDGQGGGTIATQSTSPAMPIRAFQCWPSRCRLPPRRAMSAASSGPMISAGIWAGATKSPMRAGCSLARSARSCAPIRRVTFRQIAAPGTIRPGPRTLCADRSTCAQSFSPIYTRVRPSRPARRCRWTVRSISITRKRRMRITTHRSFCWATTFWLRRLFPPVSGRIGSERRQSGSRRGPGSTGSPGSGIWAGRTLWSPPISMSSRFTFGAVSRCRCSPINHGWRLHRFQRSAWSAIRVRMDRQAVRPFTRTTG